MRQRRDVIARQLPGLERLGAIETEIGVAFEQRAVVQGRHVAVAHEGQSLARAVRGNDGTDVDLAAMTVGRAEAAEHGIEKRSAGVSDLLGMIEAYRFAVVDPFERHSGNVGSQNLLREIGGGPK